MRACKPEWLPVEGPPAPLIPECTSFRAAGSSAPAPSHSEAEAALSIGVPAAYDARYRVSCTLALDKGCLRAAARAVGQRMGRLQRPPQGWSPEEVREGPWG